VSTTARRRVLFLLFFVSGACGLLYQIVWLRLAFAAFGVITPVLSVVVAVFMLGRWGAGKWVGAWSRRSGLSAIYLYAAAEIVVGISAFTVTTVFRTGASWLLPLDSWTPLPICSIQRSSSVVPSCPPASPWVRPIH